MPQDNSSADWSKWSMYLIEGIKSMRENIGELYQLIHDLDMSVSEGRQKMVQDFTVELQKLRTELQKEIYNTNVEITRLQVKMTVWSGIFAFIGTVFGAIIAYLFKDLLIKLK